jgi:hypothetical protein
VELMVVVLVIGVLIAIGLPVFLGAKTRSQERAAQAQLRTALIGGLTYWSEGATFTGFDQGCSSSSDTCLVADATEASIAWVGPGQPGISQVSVRRRELPPLGGAERDGLVLLRRPVHRRDRPWTGRQLLGSRQRDGVRRRVVSQARILSRQLGFMPRLLLGTDTGRPACSG